MVQNKYNIALTEDDDDYVDVDYDINDATIYHALPIPNSLIVIDCCCSCITYKQWEFALSYYFGSQLLLI